jgi:protein transport protein HofQ
MIHKTENQAINYRAGGFGFVVVIAFFFLLTSPVLAESSSRDPFWSNVALGDSRAQSGVPPSMAKKTRPLRRCHYKARYLDADTLRAQFKKEHVAALKAQSIWTHPKSNTIELETYASCDTLLSWLNSHDHRADQVRIHAYLLTLNREKSHDFGLDLGFHRASDEGGGGFYRSLPFSGQLQPKTWRLMTLKGGISLDAHLEAMEAEGSAVMLSSPQIITQSGKKASIESGDELPYTEMNDGQTHIQFKKAVLSLEITPYVYHNHDVDLTIHVTQDKVSHLTQQGQAGIDTKTLDTHLLVHPKNILVLGGLFEQAKHDQSACVPWLHQLPWIGFLFCHQHKEQRRQALWVFIQVDVLD